MNSKIADTPKDLGSHWGKSGLRPGQAFEPFWEFHRRIEDRLRNRFSRKYPDISYEEIEALTAIAMLEKFRKNPEKFLSHLPTASAGDEKSMGTAEVEPPANDLDPKLLADMVKWRV